MEAVPPKASKTRRWLKLFLKLLVTAVCLWYVSRKIDFSEAARAIQEANWFFLLGAWILFVLSKLVSAFRLNIYFKNIGLLLPSKENIKLYWLGMFYNIFLPGSISGDAYKVVILSRQYNIPYKKTTAAVLLDRFSGLAGLGIVLAAFGIFVLPNMWWICLLILSALAAVSILYAVIRWKFKDFVPGFTSTLLLGILVQVLQCISIYILMYALGISHDHTSYIFLFLLSSVVSVLPLTIGGLGAREIVFLEGSKYFGLLKETSVVISLLFYLLTLVTSLAGAWYIFHDPLEKKKDSKE